MKTPASQRSAHLHLLPRSASPPVPVTSGLLAPFRRRVRPSDSPPALIVHAFHEWEFRHFVATERLCASRVVWCADLTSTHVVRDVFRHHGRSVIVITVGEATLEPGEWEAGA